MNEGRSRVMLGTMQLLLRAIITGFGYKIGAEIGRYVATKVGLVGRDKAEKEEAEEELPEGIPMTPPDDGDDVDVDDVDVEADRERSDD